MADLGGFNKTGSVPHGAMQLNMLQPAGPGLGGQFAMNGPSGVIRPSPGMFNAGPQMMQQQAQISSSNIPHGAQPLQLAGAMPPAVGQNNGAAPVPQRMSALGIQAPQQPFFGPKMIAPQQQQAPMSQQRFLQQPQQQFQPQAQQQQQFQLAGNGMEIHTILVEGTAPNGQKYTAPVELEFPRGTQLSGVREVATA